MNGDDRRDIREKSSEREEGRGKEETCNGERRSVRGKGKEGQDGKKGYGTAGDGDRLTG